MEQKKNQKFNNIKLYDDDKYLELGDLMSLFGDMNRLKILHLLSFGEMCVNDIAEILNITKSAVSHHLKSLKTSYLVKFRRDGQNLYYSLADEHVLGIFNLGMEHLGDFTKDNT